MPSYLKAFYTVCRRDFAKQNGPFRISLKCHEEVLSLQTMIPPKRFDIFPPDWGICSEGLDVFRFFFKRSFTVSRGVFSAKRETAKSYTCVFVGRYFCCSCVV